MKRKVYLFLCILACFTFVTACGKEKSVSEQGVAAPSDSSTDALMKEDNSEEDTEDTDVPDDEVINPDAEDEPGDEQLDTDSDDEQNDVPVEDGWDEEEGDSDNDDTDSNSNSNTTDAQNKVRENPDETFNGSGTFNGFVDSSSVEITMSDGSYQTFFVYNEDVLTKLQKLEEAGDSPSIRFTYRGISGQVNPEIISIQ